MLISEQLGLEIGYLFFSLVFVATILFFVNSCRNRINGNYYEHGVVEFFVTFYFFLGFSIYLALVNQGVFCEHVHEGYERHIFYLMSVSTLMAALGLIPNAKFSK